MSFNNLTMHAGYYLITIRPNIQDTLLANNSERAFVISQLQDMLTMRLFPETRPISHNLAAHIDLLAFSILKEAVQVVIFAIAPSSAQLLATNLCKNIQQHKEEWVRTNTSSMGRGNASIALRKLAGQHEALQASVQLHIVHLDWEYDRYSSIGFYLHDRRGDWMRIWRLTHIYESDASNYRSLCLLALNDFNVEAAKVALLAN